MNPFDVKKKALGAVKGYGREGIGEMLKKSYGKPAVSISIDSTKAEPGMGEAEDEMVEGESKITPELLEMLLAKLGK